MKRVRVMNRLRKKKEDESRNDDRWLITYADLITLLLIFFVVMYAMSQVDVAKYDALSQSLRLEFNKADSILPQNSGLIGGMNAGRGKDGEQPDHENIDTELREQELQDLLRLIHEYIDENMLGDKLYATDSPRGISIKLNDRFLFDLGRADLRNEAIPVLEKLSSLFPSLHTKISIEGHTDDLPVATGSLYRDNWGLSQARSLSVLRYFIYTANLDDRNFIASGYADTMPIAPNDSSENRQKNRRVEIVVLRNDLS